MIVLVMVIFPIVPEKLIAQSNNTFISKQKATLSINYPEEGTIFPPEFPPPLFQWRDSSETAKFWRIDIVFGDQSRGIHSVAKGELLRVGPIDNLCVSPNNQIPRLTPEHSLIHTWRPGVGIWESIKRHSMSSPATVTIAGVRSAQEGQIVSLGRVKIRTSHDPVGAPVFYRDVPLMPTATQTGEIKPLPSEATHLVKWRLRNIQESSSPVVLEEVPVCANCHSFSLDGKTMGMDLDGLRRNKGLYTLSPVGPEVVVKTENVIQWRTTIGPLNSGIRAGFLSQVSPDGQYVVTTLDPITAVEGVGRQASTPPTSTTPSNYYVANFKDYRFLQVFFPARGILSWYSQSSGILRPLPGADDPRFVQANAVWSPDRNYLVFARATAREPNPEGAPKARYANDPNELQIQYDLYRIPFNDGRGGTPEPLEGASRNGMSNSFPKVSPDGRWIVFVQARNGLLMRPDSQLYIIPAAGGKARRMRCNTSLMNSWHSFSPNGRWLVFSSKSRSPYTQMLLTHLDEDGQDSPPLLVENTTASNRAVNLPEFVNVSPGGLRSIGGAALDFYKLYDQAMYWQKKGEYSAAVDLWKKILVIQPEEPLVHANYGIALSMAGRQPEAAAQFEKARELKLLNMLDCNPQNAQAHDRLGSLLFESGRKGEALSHFRRAVQLQPLLAPPHCHLGEALAAQGQMNEAQAELQKSLEIDPAYAPAHLHLGILVAQRGESENAIQHWRKALEIDPGLGEAHYYWGRELFLKERPSEALPHWQESLQLQPNAPWLLREMAWILATYPEAKIRNGNEALQLAVRANLLSSGQEASILDALAAAYAELGRFSEAIKAAHLALSLINDGSPPYQSIEARIKLFEAAQPYREPFHREPNPRPSAKLTVERKEE